MEQKRLERVEYIEEGKKIRRQQLLEKAELEQVIFWKSTRVFLQSEPDQVSGCFDVTLSA